MRDRISKLLHQPVIERLPQTRPADEFNRELVDNVRPLDWVNPKPARRYNLVVIAAGTAGLSKTNRSIHCWWPSAGHRTSNI